MDGSRSREALAEFLDYLAAKGLMAKATVHARKAAASMILGILEVSEAEDVTILDLEDVTARFSRLHGKRYTPASLVSYKGRLRSAIEDFQSYLANPLAFRPSVQNRERVKTRALKDAVPISGATPVEGRAEPVRSTPAHLPATNILPIAIRADLTVYIQGLPFDLTETEARKIAAVVTAMGSSV